MKLTDEVHTDIFKDALIVGGHSSGHDLPVSIPDVGTDESLYLPSTSVPPDPVNRRMRQRGRVDYSQFF